MLGGLERQERCIHRCACVAQHQRCRPIYGSVHEALGCAKCPRFVDARDCPLDLSGTMRCRRECLR